MLKKCMETLACLLQALHVHPQVHGIAVLDIMALCLTVTLQRQPEMLQSEQESCAMHPYGSRPSPACREQTDGRTLVPRVHPAAGPSADDGRPSLDRLQAVRPAQRGLHFSVVCCHRRGWEVSPCIALYVASEQPPVMLLGLLQTCQPDQEQCAVLWSATWANTGTCIIYRYCTVWLQSCAAGTSDTS